MVDSILNKQTSLSGEEVITRAVQFFSTEKWRPTTQSARAATFQGMPPIPWFMLLLTIAGFMFCLVPGVIMWFLVIRKARRFQNLVVTVSPAGGGTDVTIMHPSQAKKLAQRFLNTLP